MGRLTGRITSFFAITCILLLSTSARGQSREFVTIGKTRVDVSRTTGLVNFSVAEEQNKLSFTDKSFFNVRLGSELYSNHDMLPEGVKSLGVPSVSVAGDSIVAIWETPSVRITQQVIPQLTAEGLVPAIRYIATNTSIAPIDVQPQYLLDVAIGKTDCREYKLADDAPSRSWAVREGAAIPGFAIIPEFSFELPDPGTLWLLTFEEGQFASPDMVMFGSWEQLERVRFIDPAMSLPAGEIHDLAIVIQWGKSTLNPGVTGSIASFIHTPTSGKIPNSSVALELEIKSRLWPNPASDLLLVDLAKDLKVSARIVDALGKTVWTGALEGHNASIDVHALSAGNYFLLTEGATPSPFTIQR
jgi:hypothetical protein